MNVRFKRILNFLKRKYVFTLLAFLIWLLIFDQNNLIDRIKYLREKKQLEKDRQYYIERIEQDNKRLQELKTNDENLEKFAREKYLMKKENEDIFIVVDEE